MKVRLFTALAVTIFCLDCVSVAGASQITVNFDNLTTTCCSGNAPLSNSLNSWLTFGVMRIGGGTVMKDVNATTPPNVYAAADLSQSNQSNLPEHVEMVFSSPVSNVSFDVINGGAASSFTAFVFDAHGNPLGVDTINLNCWNCSGAVSRVSFDFGGIGEVVVRNSLASSFVDFAVDTVRFSTVPEPGGLMLLGTAVVAVCSLRKRFIDR